jgi:hypothetical protein
VPLEGTRWRLDLDHVGAHVGEVLRTGRTLQEVAERDNAGSGQREFGAGGAAGSSSLGTGFAGAQDDSMTTFTQNSITLVFINLVIVYPSDILGVMTHNRRGCVRPSHQTRHEARKGS